MASNFHAPFYKILYANNTTNYCILYNWHYIHEAIFLHDRSWLTVLPYENFEVRSLLLKHNDRVKRGDYNREFGLHPNFKFAGNGLSEFKNQENIGIFTGAIHLLESSLNKNDMRVVVVGDRSGSLEVMIGKKMRTKLESMTHVSDNSFDPSKRFLASIRSFNYESRRVFVLANIAPCDWTLIVFGTCVWNTVFLFPVWLWQQQREQT